jgi:hypothetical protein
MQKLFFLIFGRKANPLQGRVVRMTGILSSFAEPGAKSTTKAAGKSNLTDFSELKIQA